MSELKLAEAVMAFAKPKEVRWERGDTTGTKPTQDAVVVVYTIGTKEVEAVLTNLDAVYEALDIAEHVEEDVRRDANEVLVMVAPGGRVDRWEVGSSECTGAQAADNLKELSSDPERVAWWLWQMAEEDGVPALIELLRAPAQ